MEILVHPENKTQADALKTIPKDMHLIFEEKKTTIKKNNHAVQRDKLKRGLKQAMKEVRLHQEGKLKSAKELLDEL